MGQAIRLAPVQMALVYWNRMHLRSLKEVDMVLYTYRKSEETTAYWAEVKQHLQRRVKK